jgi:hypothetical protein
MRKLLLCCCIFVTIAAVMVGCRHRPKPDALSERIGSNCTVYFNRSALGGTSATIVPVICDNTNGAQVSMSGKLLKLTFDWIVLEYYLNNDLKMKRTAWIPRSVVLWVSTE